MVAPSSFALFLALTQPALEGARAEEFLRTAKVVGLEAIPDGVTNPSRLELTDGSITVHASWKTVDIHKRGISRLADGTVERNFSDSYKYEIAAYELDKLLGIGLVPATVERQIRRERGAVILWIENATTDFDRRGKNLSSPDKLGWVRQYYNLMLFRNLIYDVDYKNAKNNLIDENWKLWAIDCSRAFRLKKELLKDYRVDNFSRSVLSRLRALDFDTLKEHLGAWISDARIEALLARRDLLVRRADELVEERGEAAILFP